MNGRPLQAPDPLFCSAGKMPAALLRMSFGLLGLPGIPPLANGITVLGPI